MRPECEDLKDRLSDLVEEELRSEMPAAERERLLLHASRCTECGESLRSYRLLLTALGSLKRIQAPPGMTQDILRQIGLEGSVAAGPAVKKGPRAPLRVWALGLAATVAIAGGVWLVTGRRFREEPPEDRSLELARAQIRSPVGANAKGLESGAGAERLKVLPGEDSSDKMKDLARKQPEPVVFTLSARDEEEAESVVQLARLFGAPLKRDALKKSTARPITITFDIDEARLPDLKQGLHGLGARLRDDDDKEAPATRAFRGRREEVRADRPPPPARPLARAPAGAAEAAAEGKLALEEFEEADTLKREAAEPAPQGRGAAPARRQVVIVVELP